MVSSTAVTDYLNTLGTKILADDFIRALNTPTWHRISQENATFDKNNPETKSNSKISKNFSQDTFEGKRKGHINFENLSFSFLKKTKSKHPKNFFFWTFDQKQIWISSGNYSKYLWHFPFQWN